MFGTWESIADLRMFESVQHCWTKKIDGLADMSYANCLSRLKLFSNYARFVRSKLIKYYKAFADDFVGNGVGLSRMFTAAPDARTHGHGLKPHPP